MKNERPLILVVNDDGIHAPGIKVLADELRKMARVIVVAPSSEQSGQSQAITLSTPLRVHELGNDVYAVDGSPADCVMLARQQLIAEDPDWVVSGINRGGNLGTDIMYSGTVGAALEGCLSGVKSMAVSLEGTEGEPMNYQSAAIIARRILENPELSQITPGEELINLNVPDFPFEGIRGVRVAKVGRRLYEGKMWERHDPRGRKYYWIGGGGYGHEPIPGSDCVLLYEGYATVSILRPDFFDAHATKRFEEVLNTSTLRTLHEGDL